MTTSTPLHPLDIAAAIDHWVSIGGRRIAPQAVEVIEESKKSRVYRLPAAGPGASGVIAKRRRASVLRTERLVYERIGPALGVPMIRLYGCAQEDDFAWHFLEDGGRGFLSVNLDAHLTAVANWLAAAHTALEQIALDGLPELTSSAYLVQLERAAERIDGALTSGVGIGIKAEQLPVLRHAADTLSAVRGAWDEIVDRSLAVEPTLVHGDLSAKNILVRERGSEQEIMPIDWETCGWGSPAPDLALLLGKHLNRPDFIDRYTDTRYGSRTGVDAFGAAQAGRTLRSIAAIEWAIDGHETNWGRKPARYIGKFVGDIELSLAALRIRPDRSRVRSPLERPRPDDATLARRIATAVGGGPIRILERHASGSGTLPKEVVRYESATRATGSLFCKYSAARSAAYGHRGGLLYEADVYRHVLAAAIVPVPKLVSAGGDDHRGSWLMLSFLDNAERLSEAYGHMVDAAAWLGRFHSQQSGRLHDPELAFLNRYDEEYYRGWADRTVLFARQRPQRVPWLEPLSEHYQAMVPTLTAAPQTVIHGEFTVHNTMVQDGCIYPTDWETAAIASGDIDLMCLVDAWPSDVVSACIAAYTAARWPGGSPPGRDEQLIAAELYLHFRWLGESPRLMVGKKRIWRFGRLQALAERLGVPA